MNVATVKRELSKMGITPVSVVGERAGNTRAFSVALDSADAARAAEVKAAVVNSIATEGLSGVCDVVCNGTKIA